MDSSRSSLPNVDRANSTLFKRYLEEQHKSVVKTNNYPQLLHPINSTIQITHTHRQQDAYTSKYSNNNITSSHHQQPVLIRRKSSNGRKTSGDTIKQRSSHTSRFMKRFQRQHKNGETLANVQKRDGRPRFEFHDSSSSATTTKQTRIDQQIRCTCLILSNQNRFDNYQHHPHCPAKSAQVHRLSFNEILPTNSQHQRTTMPGVITLPPSSPKTSRSPLPMLPPSANPSIQEETLSNLTYPIESNPLPSHSIINTESETFILDIPLVNLSNEYYPIINDFLQEISMEMNDKPSVDILLEIEESLAQRIYDCIIEENNEDQIENDTISYSTTTNDSSAISAPVPPIPLNKNNSLESNDLPPSPINAITKDSTNGNREKYFQPIREPITTTFDNLLDRNRHSTPFHRIDKQIENDVRSPFTQSLFEPVNLLRTVNDNNDNFNFFPSSFSFEQYSSIKNEQITTTTSFFNHLLSPQTTPIEKNFSAFKPIEPSSTRTTTSFLLARPQIINNSTGVHWFGQS